MPNDLQLFQTFIGATMISFSSVPLFTVKDEERTRTCADEPRELKRG